MTTQLRTFIQGWFVVIKLAESAYFSSFIKSKDSQLATLVSCRRLYPNLVGQSLSLLQGHCEEYSKHLLR